MIPIIRLKRAIYRWLTDSTGLPVVWSFQNAPEPTETFFLVDPVYSSVKIGLTEPWEILPSGLTGTYPIHEVRSTIDACGPNALVALSIAHDRLAVDGYYVRWFGSNDMSARTGEIRNLSGLRETRYSLRYRLDLFITVCGVDTDEEGILTDDPGYAERVVYAGEIEPDLVIPETTIPEP